MSLGTWSLTIYSLPLTLIVAIEVAQLIGLMPSSSIALGWVHWIAVVSCLLPAFGSVAYKGVLFSTSSQPGWKDTRLLGAWMANSALMLGCAELLAISVLTGHARSAAALRTITAVLVILNVIPTTFVFLEIRETLARIFSDQQIWRALLLTLVVGTLVPVVLLLAGDTAPWSLGAVFLIVLGGFAVRSLFLKIPHASHESRSGGKKSGSIDREGTP